MQLRHHAAKIGRVDAFRLDPRAIKIDPAHNIRVMTSVRTREHVEELKISIRAEGVKRPIEVRMVGEDVVVTDGECRLTAVQELIRDEGFDITSVLCLHEPDGTTPVERVLNLGIANSSERPAPLEMAELCKRALRLGGTEAQIAAALGWKSISSVKQHLDMLVMPEEVKEKVREGVISATLASRMAKSASDDPDKTLKLISDMEEEQKRLNGKRRVTQKTLTRSSEKAKAAAAKPEKSASAPAPITDPQPQAIDDNQSQTATVPDPAAEALSDITGDGDQSATVVPLRSPERQANGSKPNPELIKALEPFAHLAHDHDLNELADDYVFEIPAKHVKHAWVIFARFAGEA